MNFTLQHMHFPFAPKKVEKCNLCTGVAVVLTTIAGLFKFCPKIGQSQILIHMSRNICANIGKFGHSLSSGNCLHHIVSQIWNLRFRGLLHKIDFQPQDIFLQFLLYKLHLDSPDPTTNSETTNPNFHKRIKVFCF